MQLKAKTLTNNQRFYSNLIQKHLQRRPLTRTTTKSYKLCIVNKIIKGIVTSIKGLSRRWRYCPVKGHPPWSGLVRPQAETRMALEFN